MSAYGNMVSVNRDSIVSVLFKECLNSHLCMFHLGTRSSR